MKTALCSILKKNSQKIKQVPSDQASIMVEATPQDHHGILRDVHSAVKTLYAEPFDGQTTVMQEQERHASVSVSVTKDMLSDDEFERLCIASMESKVSSAITTLKQILQREDLQISYDWAAIREIRGVRTYDQVIEQLSHFCTSLI